MYLRRLIQCFRDHQERHRTTIERLRRAYEQSQRLWAEQSHLEHEIYELWASNMPRYQKRFLEDVLRSRCRKVQSEMAKLQAEIHHSGHHIWSGADHSEKVR